MCLYSRNRLSLQTGNKSFSDVADRLGSVDVAHSKQETEYLKIKYGSWNSSLESLAPAHAFKTGLWGGIELNGVSYCSASRRGISH